MDEKHCPEGCSYFSGTICLLSLVQILLKFPMADACKIIFCAPKRSLSVSRKQTEHGPSLHCDHATNLPTRRKGCLPVFCSLSVVRWLNCTYTPCSTAKMKLQSMTGYTFLFNSGQSCALNHCLGRRNLSPELRAWLSLQFPLGSTVNHLESVATFSCKAKIRLPLFQHGVLPQKQTV